MARGVSQEQVNAAIDRLLAAGERPTIERVRALLGTGSPNTLTRMLNVWWQGLGERLTAQRLAVEAPATPAPVIEAASAVWAAALLVARDEAERGVAAQWAALEAERARLAQAREEQTATLAAAELRAEQADSARREAEGRLGDLARLADHLAAEAKELREREAATDGKNEALVRELRTAQALLDTERQQAASRLVEVEASFRATESRWISEVDLLRQERGRLTREIRALDADGRQALRSVEDRVMALTIQLSESGKREAAATARVSALEEELQRLHRQLGARIREAKPTVGKRGRRSKKPPAARD